MREERNTAGQPGKSQHRPEPVKNEDRNPCSGRPDDIKGQENQRLQAYEAQLDYLNHFRQLLIDISSVYINLPLEAVDREIQKSLEKMGRFVEADRVYIFDYDWDRQLTSNTHEWCEEGISPQIDELQLIPLEYIPYWVETHKKGQAMHIPDVFALPEGDGVRAILEPQEIKSLVTIPMMDGDTCIGFVGFDSVRKHHLYSETDMQLLKVFAQLLVNINLRRKNEKELLDAKEKAEESERLKVHFLNNLSHEIRTPMNAILGFVYLLKKVDLHSEERDKYISLVSKGGERLMQTINDIIEASEIETGQIKIVLRKTEVLGLLQEVSREMKPEADQRGLEFIFNTGSDIEALSIVTDADKLKRILEHLLNNALKFTPRGSIELGYSLQEHALIIFVKDTGLGIPSNRLEAIFHWFVQADINVTRPHEGSGLGLSIARAYAVKLGGKLWVESETGQGSTFFLSLPYHQ